MSACLRCDGSGKEHTGLQVNDGTMTCPTCCGPGAISTIRATRELRAQLAEALQHQNEHQCGLHAMADMQAKLTAAESRIQKLERVREAAKEIAKYLAPSPQALLERALLAVDEG